MRCIPQQTKAAVQEKKMGISSPVLGTGYWEGSGTNQEGGAGQGGQGPCFFHVPMGNKLIHEMSDYRIPKYFNLSLWCGQIFLVSQHDQDKNVSFLLSLPLTTDNEGHQSAGQVAYIGHTIHAIWQIYWKQNKFIAQTLTKICTQLNKQMMQHTFPRFWVTDRQSRRCLF